MTTWQVSIEYNVREQAREKFEDLLYDNGFEMQYVVACADVACYEVSHDDEWALLKFIMMNDHESWNLRVGTQ